jgi:Protein of unknown function (DUF1769)
MMMRKMMSKGRSVALRRRRNFDDNIKAQAGPSKPTGGIPLVGVAVGASCLYLLEETRNPFFVYSSTLFSAIDHSYPLTICNIEKEQKQIHPQQIHDESTRPAEKVDFPSLKARLVQRNTKDGEPNGTTQFSFNSDEPIPIDNNLFQGTVTLVLRPLQLGHDPKFQERFPSYIRQSRDDVPTFYFVLRGKFKRPVPKDSLMVGGELVDVHVMDDTLSGWTRRCADVLLRLLSRNIGGNMSYSFGGRKGRTDDRDPVERPHITFPVATAMTVDIESNGPTGASANTWDTETTYTFVYCASSIDLATWKVTYPFEMDVQQFWGDSPLRLVIYEKSEKQRDNSYLFELQLEHHPIHQVDENRTTLRNEQPLLSISL